MDSRSFGFVDIDDIKGYIIAILYQGRRRFVK